MEEVIDKTKLSERFPKLKYDEKSKEIVGTLVVKALCKDEYINSSFEIRICNIESGVPFVFETSKKVNRRYQHLYKDYRLCLATDLEQELYLKEHSIIEWIDMYVVSYFVSYVYYEKYNVFPYGEHSHGETGVYEFLQKMFCVSSVTEAKTVLEYICNKSYRGHRECPCGSGIKLRKCHGKLIMNMLKNGSVEILKDHYRRLKNVGRNKK